MNAPALVFDLDVGGHHPEYLLHLARRAAERDQCQRLVFAVADSFQTVHPAEHDAIVAYGARFVTAPQPTGLRPIRHAMAEWKALTRLAGQVGAQHVMAMYIDRLVQVPLALHRRSPATISGIYFRPTFHYPQLTGTEPTRAERVRGLRQAATVAATLSHPRLGRLFTLDPFAARFCRHWRGGHRMAALADPVQTVPVSDDEVQHLRQRLQIAPDRTLCLLFGVLTARKGIEPVLTATERLGDDAKQIALLLAGPLTDPSLRTRIERSARTSAAQIILDGRQLDADEVHTCFAAADLVLAPYQKHVGMSGLLIRAAAAGKPLIASDYGLMGALTRFWSLGLTVDSTSPGAIAAALKTALTGAAIGNPTRMARFAEHNAADRFADDILDTLLA